MLRLQYVNDANDLHILKNTYKKELNRTNFANFKKR